jgi:PEP-CTERM motif
VLRRVFALVAFSAYPAVAAAQPAAWGTYAGDAQHTALSGVGSQPLQAIRWQTAVDLAPQYSGNDLLIHYGSPVISANNTVVVPVKTGATDGFRVEGRSGTTGALLWTQPTDYALPPHNWTPSYSPAIAPGNLLYYAGAGGTVYRRGNLDAAGAVTPTQLSFVGAGGDATNLGNYSANKANYDANVRISTPITADGSGNIYFGYQVQNPAAVGGLGSGLARIDPSGHASFVTAASLAPAGDTSIRAISLNSAPAVTADGGKVYVTVNTADSSTSQFGNGYLVALNTSNLSVAGRVDLRDVKTPANRAVLANDGTASPMIGPNGDVYFGVLESPVSTSKGWMLHFDSTLTQSKPAGAFGWDATASVVPRSMVPSYAGTSPYLIMTKYNDYAGLGGSGINKIAILDPNATQIDTRSGATVMREVLTIAGPTPDPEYIATHPNAVREWCINTAAIDPATFSVLANSEDGKLYRWDLRTNTFTEAVTLTAGVGEAYTPTLIGPDGTVYAINNGTLFAVGTPVPEPASVLALAGAALAIGTALRRRRGARRS